MILYHATTEKKAKAYRESGAIHAPVRGFTTLQGAMAWAMKVGRRVIYQIEGGPAYKLPDHHNPYGEAWWIDSNVRDFRCVFSAEKDAYRRCPDAGGIVKHHFSIIREILQDAADMETHADNERACLTGRTTPNSAFVALEAIEARVAELERDLDRERESNKRLATKILKLTEVKRSR